MNPGMRTQWQQQCLPACPLDNKEHAAKVEGEEEFVCEEADCLLIWLEDKTFSVTLVSHTKIHFSSKILIQTVAGTIAVHAF